MQVEADQWRNQRFINFMQLFRSYVRHCFSNDVVLYAVYTLNARVAITYLQMLSICYVHVQMVVTVTTARKKDPQPDVYT